MVKTRRGFSKAVIGVENGRSCTISQSRNDLTVSILSYNRYLPVLFTNDGALSFPGDPKDEDYLHRLLVALLSHISFVGLFGSRRLFLRLGSYQ